MEFFLPHVGMVYLQECQTEQGHYLWSKTPGTGPHDCTKREDAFIKAVHSPRTLRRISSDPGVTVMPKPYGKVRAEELMAAAQATAKTSPAFGLASWSEFLHHEGVMTPEENAYTLCLWDYIPSGSSCYMSAFYMILQGKVGP